MAKEQSERLGNLKHILVVLSEKKNIDDKDCDEILIKLNSINTFHTAMF